jgi:hypothetical protein
LLGGDSARETQRDSCQRRCETGLAQGLAGTQTGRDFFLGDLRGLGMNFFLEFTLGALPAEHLSEKAE